MLGNTSTLRARIVFAAAVCVSAPAPADPRPVLGQIVSISEEESATVWLDGVQVPPGSTLRSGTTVWTEWEPCAVHVPPGVMVRLDGFSTARFRALPWGALRIDVLAGQASWRDADGVVRASPGEVAVILVPGLSTE